MSRRPPQILHLFSNYKWTGPAEPAFELARGLAAAGVRVVFRSSGYTKGNRENPVAERAAARGLPAVTDLHLSKHRAPWRDLPDIWRLRRLVRGGGFDLVHCHLPNDTRIADRSLRGARVPWVRSLYDTEIERVPAGDLDRLRRARAVFVFSERIARELEARGVAGERLVRLEAAVDLERFHPGPPKPERRRALGFSESDFLVGIVARVQPQRRFDLLLDVAERVARSCPEFRLLIIGRGSKLDRTAREPARRRGLLDRCVFFPGYFDEETYPDVLRALDVKLFLVPGTDGTARAVREALACGRPVVTTRRGILPELVRDGVTGFAREESADAFAEALLALWRDPEARGRMGRAAREDACRRFALSEQVARVARAYREVAGSAA